MEQFPAIVRLLEERRVSLPLLMVNGQLRPDTPVTWRALQRELAERGVAELGKEAG